MNVLGRRKKCDLRKSSIVAICKKCKFKNDYPELVDTVDDEATVVAVVTVWENVTGDSKVTIILKIINFIDIFIIFITSYLLSTEINLLYCRKTKKRHCIKRRPRKKHLKKGVRWQIAINQIFKKDYIFLNYVKTLY